MSDRPFFRNEREIQKTLEDLAFTARTAAEFREPARWVSVEPTTLGPNEFVLAGKYRITVLNQN